MPYTLNKTSWAEGEKVKALHMQHLEAGIANASFGTVNVKEEPFNAKGNGVADDWKAIQEAINSLGTTGGTVYLPQGEYLTSKTIEMTNPGRLIGAGTGVTEIAPTVIRPAKETTGILMNDPGDSVISGLLLWSRNTASGKAWPEKESPDVGIRVKSHGSIISDVVCGGFGQHGVSVDTTVTGNSTLCRLEAVRCAYNFVHGILVVGVNSNGLTLTSCETQFNKGWGFYTDGSAEKGETWRGAWKAATAYAVNDVVLQGGKTYYCIKAMTAGEDKEPPNVTFWKETLSGGASNVFLGCVAEQNTLGGFYDGANGNHYYGPYVEPGTGYNVTLAGFQGVYSNFGSYQNPVITTNGSYTIFQGQSVMSPWFMDKGFGAWKHAAPGAQHAEVPVPGAFKKGAQGFETEAEAKAIRDKLTEAIEILKEYGMTK